MAEPMISARSQAQIAISQSTQRPIENRPGIVVAAGLREGSRPVTIPSRAPERLKQHGHEIRQEDDAEELVSRRQKPPARSVAQFPGSM